MRSTLMWFLLSCFFLGSAAPVWSEDGSDDPLEDAQQHGVDVSCLLEPVVKLTRQSVIRQQVVLYNRSEHPSPEVTDSIWADLTPDSPQLKAVLNNEATEILRQFIALVSLRGEGMLMGADGGLVAATNHTTDFWQGDEEQFRRVMDGHDLSPIILSAYHDASTHHILIKIAAPVVNDRGDKIGVLVVGFDALVMEYRQLC